MFKTGLLASILILFALQWGCGEGLGPGAPRTAIPTNTRPATVRTTQVPRTASVPTRVASRSRIVTEPGKPSTTFTARQRPTSIPPLTNCGGWYDDVKGVAFQITDEGLIQLEVKFTFEVIDGRRGLIPNLFFIYPGDYIYVERKGVETFLFRVDAIRVGQGAYITIGGEGSCGGRVS